MRINGGGSDTPFDTKDMIRYLKAVAFFGKNPIVNEFERGNMNRSIKDIAGAALIVSQFTLAHYT